MILRNSLALFVALGTAALLSACPPPDDPPPPPDAGNINLADAGPFVPPPDAGHDDAGTPIVVDAGPINSTVTVQSVTPPAGPLTGLNRVRIEGSGFTGACSLEPVPGAGDCEVFFGDVKADTILPLQLPSLISVRVPPCAAPGPVDVKVVTALGIGILEGGYTCFSPVTVTNMDPVVGSTEGGETITLEGEGFTESMIVTLGDRQVVSLVVEDENTATFVTPPGTPGRATLLAIDAFGRSELPLAFTYQSPLRLDSVAPVVIAASGGDVVELLGSGFYDNDETGETVDAEIGANTAARNNLISEARLRVNGPPLAAGVHDVVVVRGATNALLEDAIVVRAAPTGAFALTAAAPSRLDVDGGTFVTLVGEGLSTTSTPAGVTVNGVAADDVTVVDDFTVTFTAPASATGVGAATIVLTRVDASTASTVASYIQPVDVDDVDPAFGPAAGGTAVTVTGRGFDLGGAVAPVVTFGGIAATDVVVNSATELTAVTPAGASGPVDVVVTVNGGVGSERAALVDGYRFDAPVTVIGVRPSRGDIGGNTFVTVTGTGFSKGPVTVNFGAIAPISTAREVVVVNDSTLTLRTPPGQPGIVDITVSVGAGLGAETSVATGVFTYFFAGGAVAGGTRGGPIDGAVYVTALDATIGLPIPGLVAWVGTDGTPTAAGITGLTGTAVVSGPDVRGPQTVTIGGNCFSTVSFVDVDAAELTAFLFPLCGAPPQPGEGPPPPPPATIRGKVTGFAKEFFDPAALDQSGCCEGCVAPTKCEIAFAEVVTTARDEFSGTPDPGGANVVIVEGGEYFIASSRPGRLAVIALAGIVDVNNQTFRLRQLGVRREVEPAFGVDLIDQDVELTIDLDAEIDLSLPDAPIRFDETNVGFVPTITRVIPFLQFGGEGALVYTQAVAGRRNHALEEMPDVPGEMLTFIAGAYTTDGRNLFTEVGTATLVEGNTRVVGQGTAFDWGATDPFTGQILVLGQVFVTNRPDGSRFASVIQGVIDADPTTAFLDNPILQLQEAPDFSSSNATYHIGSPGAPSSEVIQNGIGDLRSGVSIQPVLGLPELISPLENGVLVDRTLRWKAAPGQQPTIHDMFVYDPFNLASIWEFYVDGSRTKVVIPRVPGLEELLTTLPLDQQLCLTTVDPPEQLENYCRFYGEDTNNEDFIEPGDMVQGGLFWQHEAIFVPGLDSNNWSLIQIGTRGRRAWTTDVHGFVRGTD
jgi:hypothetical protein